MSLKLEQVTKRFGETLAVNHLNLEIQEKQIFGLLGANGAGKTTTIRMILGLLSPTSGSISWNGQKITDQDSRLIGYLPEERGLYTKLSVKEQMIYLGRLRGMKKEEVLEQLDYWLERFFITDYKGKNVEDLSKGNQQKIQFIAAVLHQPKILFLDEPFSGLDPVNAELLKAAVNDLAKQGTTIVFSSHRMEHVEELCENICILQKGAPVVLGNLSEIKRSFGKKNLVINIDQELELGSISGVLKVKKTAQGYVLQVKDEAVSQHILQNIVSKGFISRFSLEEPSLNDIFIEKVGAAYE